MWTEDKRRKTRSDACDVLCAFTYEKRASGVLEARDRFERPTMSVARRV